MLPSEEFPWIVLVVDEWAEVAASGSSKERARADELLRRYVSLGRAVGCTAILCTQRPTSEVIDVGTRTLLNERFALRCGDRHQAEAILSAGTFQPGDLIGVEHCGQMVAQQNQFSSMKSRIAKSKTLVAGVMVRTSICCL